MRETLRQLHSAVETGEATDLEGLEGKDNESSVGLWELIANGVYWSDQLKEMLGITDPGFTPTTGEFLSRIHPDDCDLWTSQCITATAIDAEIRARRNDRTYIWLHMLGKITGGADGTPLRVVGSARDISARKNAEIVRSQARERYDLALQSLSVGIWDWNLIERQLYWSPKYKQMLGITDPDYRAQPIDFEKRMHPDDSAAVTTALREHIKSDVPFDVECRLRHDDGHYMWTRLCGIAERNVAGRALRMVGSVDDISIRKEAERKLSEREARLRNMFEHAIDGLITIDTKGVVQSYNPACEKMFGYTADDVVGQNVSMLMPEPYRGEHDQYVHNYLTTGNAKIIGIGREVEGRRKDGSVFPMDLSISEFESGGETLFSGIVHDITSRKEIERMKSEFVSVVSHELRTPLTSIRGSLGLLASVLGDTLPVRATELLNIAHRNSELLMILINDILDIEKLESGTSRLALQPTVLEGLLADAVSAHASYAGRFGVTMQVWTEPGLPAVIADPDRLLQVVGNLLSNAAKFTRQGTVVDIRAEKNQHTVKISVRDRGHGVPEEIKHTIFDKFSQFDPSNSRERSGTGLGLSIARHLTGLMHGEIGFTSERDEGATFFVELPIATTETAVQLSAIADRKPRSNGLNP